MYIYDIYIRYIYYIYMLTTFYYWDIRRFISGSPGPPEVGDAGVGKSCLLLQFTDKRFRAEHASWSTRGIPWCLGFDGEKGADISGT